MDTTIVISDMTTQLLLESFVKDFTSMESDHSPLVKINNSPHALELARRGFKHPPYAPEIVFAGYDRLGEIVAYLKEHFPSDPELAHGWALLLHKLADTAQCMNAPNLFLFDLWWKWLLEETGHPADFAEEDGRHNPIVHHAEHHHSPHRTPFISGWYRN